MTANEIVAVIDTETTALDIKTARICQVAVVGAHPQDEVKGWRGPLRASTILAMNMNPGVPIPAEVAAIHGLDDALVAMATPEAVGLRLLSLMMGETATSCEENDHELFVLSYNGERYDLPLLEERFRDLRLASPGKLWAYRHIDLFPLVQRVDPTGRHKLGEAWEDMMGRPPVNAHDATADCVMVIDILQALMEMLEFDTLAQLHEYAMTAMPYTLMPFGKHKGMPVDQIPRGYWSWMYKNTEPADMSRDLRATLTKVLGHGSRDE